MTTDPRDTEHIECDCVPTLGPSHCHLCGDREGREMPWAEAHPPTHVDDRLARFHVRVHAQNRHAGYGTPMVVLAATRKQAVRRALDLGGWTGNQRRYGRVTIDRIEDVHPDESQGQEATR